MAARRVRPAPPQPRPQPTTAATAELLSATVETDGDTAVIRVVGSVVCASAPVLRDTMDTVLDQRPRIVVLDLALVSADDELGLWVLPALAGDAARRGVELVVAAPHRALRVRLRRLGGHHLEITDEAPTRQRGHAPGQDPTTVPASPLAARPRTPPPARGAVTPPTNPTQ